MEFYSGSFFCEKDKNQGPTAHISIDTTEYPISIYINKSPIKYTHPRISIHLSSEPELIHFVNSVKSAYSKYRRKKGYDK